MLGHAEGAHDSYILNLGAIRPGNQEGGNGGLRWEGSAGCYEEDWDLIGWGEQDVVVEGDFWFGNWWALEGLVIIFENFVFGFCDGRRLGIG